ncbi:unnamed protein product [Durusdinium trenchii]|uniref:Uncharacterized protein n=1 Tax=Durusdinium trenchii TaxID=1381693 RepID=A0ABP0R966_9DINO
MESTPLTLVPAAPSRRRRREEGESHRRRRASRSRDRDRASRREVRHAEAPPSDWLGPSEPERASSAAFGRSEWAPYAPPGHMAWPPQRPMYRPPGGYGPWGVPPPREPDWRPAMGAPGTWTPPAPSWTGPPTHWVGPSYEKGPFEASTPAVENGHSASSGIAGAAPLDLAGTPGGAGAAPVEEPLPPAPTASERLRNVRLVSSGLSQTMLEKLHSLGIRPKTGGAEKGQAKPVWSRWTVEHPLSSPCDASARACELGLDAEHGLAAEHGLSRSALPAPTGKRRATVCTLGLAQQGLWERFRQRCGTPLPAEPVSYASQLRSSKLGHVVVLAHEK